VKPSSLKFRLVVIIALMALVSALVLSQISSGLSRAQIERDQGTILRNTAGRMASRLSQDMSTRANEITFLTNLQRIKDPGVPLAEKKALLEQVKANHPFYAWIGMTDAEGTILIGTDDLLVGKSVAKREWFLEGSRGLHFGDAHDAFLLAKIMPKPKWDDLPLRLVDVSAPVVDAQGKLIGVICGHLSLDWAFEARQRMMHELNDPNIDLLVLNEAGKVLMGTPALPSLAVDLSGLIAQQQAASHGDHPYVVQWPDGRRYLTELVAESGFRNYRGMGWSVIARKPADIAFAPALELTETILAVGGVAVLLFAFVLWFILQRSLRPLENIAAVADRIRNDDLSMPIPDLKGNGEIAVFARSLTSLVASLQDKNEELRLAERMFSESGQGIMVTDGERTIVRVNRAFTHVTGFEAEEAIGQKPSLLRSGRHDRAFYDRMDDSLHNYGFWRGEIWNRNRAGNIYPEWLTINTLRNNEGEVCHYIAMFDDITEKKGYEERLVHLANYDLLTHLPNRHLLQSQLDNAIATAEKNEQSVALLFVDLDLFKNINDTLGHPAGDRVLEEVAKRFRQQIGEQQTLARWGGDEFVVLAPNSDNYTAAELANRLIATTDEPYLIDGQKYHIGLSCGIAMFPTDGVEGASLLRFADVAMYEAKREGSNRYRFYEHSMNDKVERFMRYDALLRRSVESGLDEFELLYQPQFDYSGSRILGVEALIRWNHPELGRVSPAEFIPVAEKTGMIYPIGRWVIDSACAAHVELNRDAAEPVTMSINISALQLQDQELCDHLCATASRYGIAHSALILEVTESAIIDNEEQATQTLTRLRDEGFNISIDDFGTGYASLHYIQKFRPNEIKVDRSFIATMLDDQDSLNIVKFTLGLSQTMAIDAVAEGVETREQQAMLQTIGEPRIQGYLLGKPMPLAQVKERLGAGKAAVEYQI